MRAWTLFVILLGVLFLCTPCRAADVSQSLLIVFGHEGGLQCDKNDQGNRRPNGTYGCTKYGIASNTYPNEDIRHLTLKRASYLYERDFWKPLMLDGVKSQGIATEIFDTAVNCGMGTSAIMVVRACNYLNGPLNSFPVSTRMNMAVIGWINGYTKTKANRVRFYKVLNILQGDRYLTIASNNPKMKKYLNSWLARVGG